MRTLILALLALLVVSCYQDDDFVPYVDESIHAILPLPDGGAICAGVRTWHGGYRNTVATSVPGPIYVLLLLRTDAQGELVWERTFEDNYCSDRMALRADADGGFTVAGFGFGSGDAPSGGYVIKTDSVGYPIWNTMVGDSLGWGSVVVATADGGFAFLGRMPNPGFLGLLRTDAEDAVILSREIPVYYALSEIQDAVELADGKLVGASNTGVVILSPQGDSLWTHYNESQSDWQLAAMPGGFAVCTAQRSGFNEARPLRLQAHAANGELRWSQQFPAVEPWWPESVLRTETGFFIAGTLNAGGHRIFTIATDPDGGNSRRSDISVTGNDRAQSAAQLSDGGFLLGGSARVPHNDEGIGNDALLVRLNSSGSPLWHRTHGM